MVHLNAPVIGAAVTASVAVAVTAFQETVVAGVERRPVSEIVTIIAAVGTLAGIIGGIVVQVVTLRIKAAVAPVVAAVAEVKVQTAEVATKAETIKHNVDGTLSRMESTLTASLKENERLVALLNTQKQEQVAAVLAATQATTVAPSAGALSVSKVQEHLERIEDNTDATAKNTAKTDVAMTEMKEDKKKGRS